MPEWVEFRRSDATAVIEMVRGVAATGDAGEHGHGVEVVVETPRRGWFAGLFDGRPGAGSLRVRVAGFDNPPEQARIAVTKPGGEVRYPFHVNLVSAFGGDAAHRLPAVPGWARSNSAGLAFLVLKGHPGDRPDWGGLVGGVVAALSTLGGDPPEDGWRAVVDRAVWRHP
ncbi:MAG: hypothetical protein V7603_2893 [Micromonosporaceae bacterium]